MAYAEGSIAGVAMEDAGGNPCKMLIVDGGNLQMTTVSNSALASDGTLYIQTSEISEGRRFGVEIASTPLAILTQVITNINGAMEANTTFNVTLDDGFHDINVACKADGEWLQYRAGRINGYIPDVVMRFITAG